MREGGGRMWLWNDACVLAIALTVALACAVAAALRHLGAHGSGGARRGVRAGLSTIVSTPTAANACKNLIRIRIVHHGNEADLFWKDVHRGVEDAERLLTNVKVHRVTGVQHMVQAIRSTPALADGLIVTCPYRHTDPEYKDVTDAIDSVIDSGVPVISCNTDTLHNPRIFQYVGSSNKLLGKRGAVTALKKYPQLMPPEQPVREGINLAVTCEERAQELMEQCRKQRGRRVVSHVVGILQERRNVTLDWRVEEFHREWNLQTQPFAATALVKTYSLEEALAAVRTVQLQPGEETCVVVATGFMTLDEAIAVRRAHPGVYVCEVGDTGANVSALAAEHDIPFVGQMQYQQGFTTVTSMHNLITNYRGGRTWTREKGNAAVMIDASYECTENCDAEQEKVVARERDRGFHSPWIQVGVAVHLEGLDIAMWDEYDRTRVGQSNRVSLFDGSTIEVPIVDGARNFGAVYASDRLPNDTRRVYEGSLAEYLHYYPLYERSVDARRGKCQYFLVTDNGTRVPMGEIEQVITGAYVRMRYSNETYRIVLYDQDDVLNLQKVLQGSLGARCAPCT